MRSGLTGKFGNLVALAEDVDMTGSHFHYATAFDGVDLDGSVEVDGVVNGYVLHACALLDKFDFHEGCVLALDGETAFGEHFNVGEVSVGVTGDVVSVSVGGDIVTYRVYDDGSMYEE